jgi:hypothetical protein
MPEKFSTVKEKLAEISSNTAIEYKQIRKILRSMPVIVIDT